MEGMYGFDSRGEEMSPENMMIPYDYHPLINSGDRINTPMFGSEEMGFQCSVDSAEEEEDWSVMKAKIASHPSYSRLLDAYIDCQKVGAPAEIVSMLEEIRREKGEDSLSVCTTGTGLDPHLDDFMERYWGILVKYKRDLSRPFDEATSFLAQIQTQFLNLCSSNVNGDEVAVWLDEEVIEMQDAETKREDRELKEKLMRMYGSHITSLKLEFSKKKKKGKLPKEGRQTLLAWWNLHSKWPYPTEADKMALAEETGLDQKQINNWFINQRKRHWKSPDNMHLGNVNFVPQH